MGTLLSRALHNPEAPWVANWPILSAFSFCSTWITRAVCERDDRSFSSVAANLLRSWPVRRAVRTSSAVLKGVSSAPATWPLSLRIVATCPVNKSVTVSSYISTNCADKETLMPFSARADLAASSSVQARSTMPCCSCWCFCCLEVAEAIVMGSAYRAESGPKKVCVLPEPAPY